MAEVPSIPERGTLLKVLADSGQTGQIADHMTLAAIGYNNSIRIWKLTASLQRQFGKMAELLSPEMTVAHLAQLVGVASGQAGRQGAQNVVSESLKPSGDTKSAPESLGAFTVGIDLEALAEMPETSDFRTHEFYAELFTPQEISRALLHPEPRRHLLGLFCAKEALKKSHPSLIARHPRTIGIGHDQGRPYVQLEDPPQGISFDCSISHSGGMATAIVIAMVRDL